MDLLGSVPALQMVHIWSKEVSLTVRNSILVLVACKRTRHPYPSDFLPQSLLHPIHITEPSCLFCFIPLFSLFQRSKSIWLHMLLDCSGATGKMKLLHLMNLWNKFWFKVFVGWHIGKWHITGTLLRHKPFVISKTLGMILSYSSETNS